MSPAEEFVSSLFSLQGLLVAGVLTAVLARAVGSRVLVGSVIAAERPRRAARIALLVLPQSVALVLVWATDAVPRGAPTVLLALGMLLVVLSPGRDDAVCGEKGVRRGWHARRLADLEAWRLAGEHLRFQLFGTWTSVPLPSAEHARMRERLLAQCPERESPFA